MREIEFRVWNKMRNEYITNSTGDLALDLQNGNVLYGILGHADNLVNITDNVLIEQYTGLKDKNGKKIFEGDIGWDDHTECLGVVVFDEGRFQYVWETVADDLYEVTGDIEIRGNKWQNPELLEAE